MHTSAVLVLLAVVGVPVGRAAGWGGWWLGGNQQDQQDAQRAWQERQDEVQRQQDELAIQRQQIQEERQRLRDDLLMERQYEQADQQLHHELQQDDRQREQDQRLDERQLLHDDILVQREFMQADRQRFQQEVVDERQDMADQHLDEHQQLQDELRTDREHDVDDQRKQRDEMVDQQRRDREREDREREQEQQRRESEREQEQQRREREHEQYESRRWRREVEAPAAAPRSYAGVQLWRVPVGDREKELQRLEEDAVAQVWQSNSSVWDMMVLPENQERLSKALAEQGLNYTVAIPDLQMAIAEENPPLSDEEMELTGRKGHRMTWQHYHRASDIFDWLDYLAQTFPDVCDVQVIGNSIEGRPLKVLRIKGRPGSPAMWIDGGIHAREWITSSSVSYMVNELIERREAHKSWLDKVELYILPLANPDGYEYSHVGDRMWRKNRRRGGGCDGTDLNRNFGYKWGGLGSGPQPCQEIYRGAGAFSEPETAAIQKFVLSHKSIKSYLSFHSYGQYVLYPWGYDRFVPPDHVDLQRVGERIANAMRGASGLSYKVGSSAVLLYPASGGSDDWAKGVARLPYAFTVELRDTGRHGFVLPASHIPSSGKEVVAAVQALATAVADSTA